MIKSRSLSTKSEDLLRLTLIEAMPFVGRNNSGIYAKLFDEIERRAGMKTIRRYGAWDSHAIGETDVVLGHTFMNGSAHADFGPIFYVDSLITIAPKPVDLFIRRNLSKIFPPEVLPVVLLAYVIAAILNSQIDKNKHLSLMVLMASYFFYRIVLEAFYVSKLASTFGTPSKSLRVTNTEILYVNGYDFFVSSSFNRIVSGLVMMTNSDWVKRHWYVVNDSTLDLFKRVALPQNHAAGGIFKSALDIYPSNVMTVDTFLNERQANFRLFCTFQLRKGNPLNPTVKYWAQEIIEKGLVRKWLRDLISANKNATIERRASETPATSVAFTLEYYQEVYALLFAGYVFALVIFVFEFIVKGLEEKIVGMKKESRF